LISLLQKLLKPIWQYQQLQQYISAKGSLDQAIHMLIVGSHQSLLVTQKEKIIGILRLTDVFANISQHMKECNL